jgi:hypothetical protein
LNAPFLQSSEGKKRVFLSIETLWLSLAIWAFHVNTSLLRPSTLRHRGSHLGILQAWRTSLVRHGFVANWVASPYLCAFFSRQFRFYHRKKLILRAHLRCLNWWRPSLSQTTCFLQSIGLACRFIILRESLVISLWTTIEQRKQCVCNI